MTHYALFYHIEPLYLSFFCKNRQNDEVNISPKNVRALWSKLATKKFSICGRVLEPFGFQISFIRQKMPFSILINNLKSHLSKRLSMLKESRMGKIISISSGVIFEAIWARTFAAKCATILGFFGQKIQDFGYFVLSLWWLYLTSIHWSPEYRTRFLSLSVRHSLIFWWS